MNSVKDRLLDAIGTGEILGIAYHGGSQRGAYREIMPLQIIGDQVRARCLMSNAVKVFDMAKIEIADRQDTSKQWMLPEERPVTSFKTLDEIFRHYSCALEAAAWTVEYLTDKGEEYLNLYKRTKSGGLLKHPTLTLSFEPTTYDLVAQIDGSIIKTNERPQIRPWGVRGKNVRTGAWGSPLGALEVFLRAAGLQLDPPR